MGDIEDGLLNEIHVDVEVRRVLCLVIFTLQTQRTKAMFKPYHQRFLKVKIKSLAEESKIIRHEEKRSSNVLRNELHNHRTWDVRRESRAALLAYTYLRGRPLSQVEGPNRNTSVDRRAQQIVKKFGTAEASKQFAEWLA